MISGKTIEVNTGGVRRDAAVLRAFPTTTRAFVREAVARGDVSVDGRAAAKGMKLRGGEKVFVRELLEASDNKVLPHGDCPRPIFDDGDILAFDKPAGQPVQPLSCRERGTLMNAVVAKYPECRDVGDSPLMAGAVHRIDADTSGLVVVARTQAVFDGLRAQFAAQKVKKTYLALVAGVPEQEKFLIDAPIGLLSGSTYQRCVREDGAEAKSLCEVLKAKDGIALVRLIPNTGRTHQLRVHMAYAGYPLIGDWLYGSRSDRIDRPALHAASLSFTHPITGEEITLSASLPFDMARLL